MGDNSNEHAKTGNKTLPWSDSEMISINGALYAYYHIYDQSCNHKGESSKPREADIVSTILLAPGGHKMNIDTLPIGDPEVVIKYPKRWRI